MADSPFPTYMIAGFEVVFFVSDGEDLAEVETVDAEVTRADGARWSVTFLTLNEVARILERWEGSGEHLSGSYLRVPDLVLMRRPGIEGMVVALQDLLSPPTSDPPLTRLSR
jgi:hypothetical protein